MVLLSGRRSPRTVASAQGRALGADVDGVERLAARQEEPVPLGPAEAEVGAALGEQDAPDQLGLGVEDGHPVLPLASAEAAPEIALGVAAEPVRDSRPCVDEGAPVGERGAVVRY